MGIDIATYRSRIGCCSHNRGTDVVTFSVDVQFSKAARYTGILMIITMLIAMAVFNLSFSHLQDKHLTEELSSVKGSVFIAGTVYFSTWGINGAMLILKSVGAVIFIQILLLSAGVESNPGPLPGSKERSEKDDEKPETKKWNELESSQAEAVHPQQTVTDYEEDEEMTMLKTELRRLKELQVAKQQELKKKELRAQLRRTKMEIQDTDALIQRLDAKHGENTLTASCVGENDPNLLHNTKIDETSLNAVSEKEHNIDNHASEENVEKDIKLDENTTVLATSHLSENDPNPSQSATIDDTSLDAASSKKHNIDNNTSVDNIKKGVPIVQFERSHICVQYGKAITLDCTVNANPSASCIKWEKTVDEITALITLDSSKYRGGTIETPSLTINSADENDNGAYRCKATNIVGTSSSPDVLVYVRGNIPQVTNNKKHYSVVAGNPVTLQCSVTSVPDLNSVTWQHTVNGITSNIIIDGLNYTGSNEESPSLTIVSASSSDNGSYICYASNEVGTGCSACVTLNVSGNAKHGENTLKASCVGENDPNLLHNTKIDETSHNAVSEKEHNIDNHASEENVEKESGTDSQLSSTKETFLKKHADDVVISVPNVTIATSTYTAIAGETITLECTVNAIPDSVKWEKLVDNTITSINIDGKKYRCGTRDSPSLVIINAESNDEASYTCKATNIVGTGCSKPTCLIVRENSVENPSGIWRNIMEKLGITTKSKLGFKEVMAVTWKQEKELQTADIPREMLRGLIMIDYKVRDNLPELIFKGCRTDNEETDFDDDAEGTFDIHTQDMFITIFDSCDSFLKQIIVNKMFICRLAIPIIYHSMPMRIPCFSLWPLRSTVFEIKDDKVSEVSIVQIPMKIVSFIRYDRLDSMSKSKLLNDILSDESHDTFYHRDCPLGLLDRKLADGLVEASWYIPAGKETDFFEHVTMFLNLRGDASKCEQQLMFLNKVSNVIVIIIDTEKVYENFSNLDVSHLQTNVVFLLTGRTVGNKSKNQKYTELCKSKIPNVTIISTYRKNAADLKKELRKRIQSLCKSGEKSLEKCAEIATKVHLFTDEETPDCKNSKREAEAIYKLLEMNGDISSAKENLLPLQGNLWKQWSDEYKKLKKPGKSSVSESEVHNKALESLRSEQENVAKKISPFLKAIIKVLTENLNNRDYISYFLNWIKFYLDHRSREIIPPLTAKYHNCWKKFKESHDENKEDDESLKHELEKAEQELSDASLGFEHIIRELGQLYEVTADCVLSDKINKQYIRGLPNIVSRLLLFGFPIELMDGDAANVPCRWIKTVFDSLIATVGDKRVLTLSILGVQSSGKSTFLNTMFGLKFAVSAGRCTRGIYMQLLYVEHCENRKKPFDYILVLDTEGIRAPELGLQKHDHDNELATLILGLGDVTIVNIKGENTSEIKDVLQIAVHAFLRLKSANKKLDLQQSCTFVHQNVAAMNAQQKMQQGTQKLVQNLDKMTAVAAEQENIRNIKTFKQVIQFDSRKNVWYLSDLWHGDPPMSHANPGYSESVKKVKESILSNVIEHRKTFLKLSDTACCLVDLWNGILADDFVFSFRNSIEMKIYNLMETKYQTLTWELEKFIDDLQRKTSLSITVKSSLENINNSFEKQVYPNEIEMANNLQDFFENHEYKDILIQWKTSKMTAFKAFTQNAIEKSKNNLKKRYDEVIIEMETDLEDNRLVGQITEKAKCLALEFKGKEPTESELMHAFELMWSTWIKSIASTLPKDKTDLCTEVAVVLYQQYPSLHTQLSIQLNETPLSSWNKNEELSEYIKQCQCIPDLHISFKHFSKKFKNWFSDQTKKEVCDFATALCKDVHTEFDTIEKTDAKFEQFHLRNILKSVDDKFEEHKNDDSKKFSFLEKFRAMVLVHICRFTVYKFKTINEQYEKKHCPEAKIALFKKSIWKMFQNIVSKKSNEIIAADLFCDTVRSFLENTMVDKIYIDIKDKILLKFQHSKYALIIEILDDLADKHDFQLFMSYVNNPYSYSLKWMNNYIEVFSFTKPKGSDKTEYAKLAGVYVEEIIEEIMEQLPEACKTGDVTEDNKMDSFITYLTQNCENFKIKEADRRRLSDFSFHDVNDFRGVTVKFLKRTKENIHKALTNVSQVKWKRPINRDIMDRLWGCEEKCPFCYEPCQGIEKNHEGNHKCVQHKPSGIIGIHSSNTKILSKESCNFSVQSPKTFRCSVVRDKCQVPNCPKGSKAFHNYNCYNEVIPDWDIVPSPDQSNSTYWNWFMAAFIDKLQEHHDQNVPEIPKAWHEITKQDAKSSLRNVYLSNKI